MSTTQRDQRPMPSETVMLGRVIVVIAALVVVIGFAWVAGWVA